MFKPIVSALCGLVVVGADDDSSAVTTVSSTIARSKLRGTDYPSYGDHGASGWCERLAATTMRGSGVSGSVPFSARIVG